MERKAVVYIGPDRPFGLPIMRNTVLADEPEKVFPTLGETFKKHPKLEKLFVPASQLAQALVNVKKNGSPLNIFAKQVEAASKKTALEAK